MFKLPNELISIIISTMNIFDIITYSQINKTNHHMVRANIRHKMNKIRQIQKIYRKKRTQYPFKFLVSFFEPVTSRRNYIIRTYIACYPSLLLLDYPEFFSEKTKIYNSTEKKLILQNYISRLPPKDLRTRRHIRDFFNLEIISVRDILYVGW